MRVQLTGDWGLAQPGLVPAGDAEITDLIDDVEVRRELEDAIEVGGSAFDATHDVRVPGALLARLPRLQSYARRAAKAAGFDATNLVPAGDDPERLVATRGLAIVVGLAVYATHGTGATTRAGALRAWSGARFEDATAFHAVYDPPEGAAAAAGDEQVVSPFVLSTAQRAAVAASRSDPLTVISGAPGTGKSHTVVAIACDAVARGQSVLVAAKSDDTVDALLDLFERAPGPDPVVFGSNERRQALAERLASGQRRAPLEHTVRAASEALERARDHAGRSREDIIGALRAEVAFDALTPTREPDWIPAGVSLDQLDRLMGEAVREGSGLRRRWERSRARRRLRSLAGPDRSIQVLDAELRQARDARAVTRLIDEGGLELGDAWERLLEADANVRRAMGEWLAADSHSARRLHSASLRAVSALATALRSGRGARREQLARLDSRLTDALPLWVGSLPDVEDLLPAIPALFDVVVLDEASSVDQALAAPALLRGRRGVVVGDPRQLRHVSFLSDAQLDRTIGYLNLRESAAASKLDLRRNSLFDVAAGSAPVTMLDEHFRSDPHLIEFVADRLYGGRVRVATRSPRRSLRDCIDVERLDGERDAGGVVQREVERALRLAADLRETGARSVGIVSPFRAQADALERAALGALSLDDMRAIDLRIGTVHAFQGNERDVVIASMGLGPDDGGAWRFVEDAHLFTVMVTRARQRMVVLLSADPPAGSLMAEYLARSDSPPGDPPCPPITDPWIDGIVTGLRAGGLGVFPAYPAGRHALDVCVDDRRRDVAIECRVHQEGPEAHVERRLALMRSGWNLYEAYPSRWADRRGELVVELLAKLA